MADDLDFRHNVSEIPEGAQLPRANPRSVSAEVTPTPDIQGAVSNYASNTNWMSSIGSKVASTASTQLAKQIGADVGKNPQGDIGLPITDFDKTMQDSYNTQAQATLGLQANKLITDSNIEMANASRITPDLIARTNKQVSMGLKNIFKNAPSAVQGALEEHYGNLQLEQGARLTERMIQEQKEDTRNNTNLASQKNAEDAYSFGMSGNDKAAKSVIETTKKLTESAYASRLITPEEAKVKNDTVRKSYESGKLIHDYEQARAKGKDEGEKFLRDVADKSDKSKPDYLDTTSNLMSYVSHQEGLRSQEQNYQMQLMRNKIATDPNVTGSDWAEFEKSVTPVQAQQMKFHLIEAQKAQALEGESVTQLTMNYGSGEAQARASDKVKNAAFYQNVQKTRESNPNISNDEAEAQVAMSAGAPVPVFQKTLENNLTSGNPANILSAAHQMELLNSLDAARAYSGVSQKAKAIALQFQQQRGSMPDTDLARKITDNLSNIDESTQKTLDNSWNLTLSSKGAAGVGATKPLYAFALNEVGLNKDKVGGSYFATIYGNDIYNQLNSNFITTRGDYPTALQMTKDYVKEHYGETTINGTKQTSDSPVEKYLGFKGHDIVPYVQQDLLNKLSTSFAESKTSTPDDYWETLPLKNHVAEVVRHVQTKDGMKQYKYPVNLVGRAGNQWDVVVQTPQGNRNLFLVAPHVGVTTYQPNKDEIIKSFTSHKTRGFLSHGK